MRKAARMAAISVLALTRPLSAQAPPEPAPTVENAQQFLLRTLPGVSYETRIVEPNDPENYSIVYSILRSRPDGPNERCKTWMNVDNFRQYNHVTNQTVSNRGSWTAIFNWSEVTEIRQSGDAISINFARDYNGIFQLSSATMAARVAYAMEFLRVQCDATAGLGF